MTNLNDRTGLQVVWHVFKVQHTSKNRKIMSVHGLILQ